MEMDSVGSWIVGAAMSLLALLGLFLAARAADPAIYIAGLALFVTGVLFVFVLIRLGSGNGRRPASGSRPDVSD